MDKIEIGKYMFAIKLIKPVDRKTDIYNIISKRSNSSLGIVKYHPAWRCYCFSPSESTLFNATCLFNMVNFLNKINTK